VALSNYSKAVASAVVSAAIVITAHFTGEASSLSFVESALVPILVTAGVIIAPANA
jgi:hypothetical protein